MKEEIIILRHSQELVYKLMQEGVIDEEGHVNMWGLLPPTPVWLIITYIKIKISE